MHVCVHMCVCMYMCEQHGSSRMFEGGEERETVGSVDHCQRGREGEERGEWEREGIREMEREWKGGRGRLRGEGEG